jgi:septum site-determining protein MinC
VQLFLNSYTPHSSSENGNLVILGNVSSGGEVVSDGDIHVYGNLRGRALAGLGGGNGRVYASR